LTKPPKRPRDPNQLAKMIVDLSTGQLQDEPEQGDSNPMASLGRAGGLKGGRARAEAMSPERRAEVARLAAAARWRKDDS